MRLAILRLVFLLLAAPVVAQELPPWAERGLPGPGHQVLEALVGDWRLEKQLFGLLGTPDAPAISTDLETHREWLADGRYLRDETSGTIAGENYWRLGLLGYSNMDEFYEWVTIDPINTMMMIYQGTPGSGTAMPINVYGVFTDQGVVSEATVGQPVAMRTLIDIESADRHVIELWFTPPGEAERLIDRTVYTRVP